MKLMEAALLVTLFKQNIVHLFCAAFSRLYCCCHYYCGFCYVCYISLCVCSVLMFYSPCSLSLSLAASMVDTMLPLHNWTFLSVGRSKGRDHFIFIIITINLPSEIFMYPRGIVILMNIVQILTVFLTKTKKINK